MLGDASKREVRGRNLFASVVSTKPVLESQRLKVLMY